MLKQFKAIKLLRRRNPTDTSFMRYTAARDGSEPDMIRQWWPLDRISPLFVCAVVKSEDFCFTRHRGVAWEATVFAMLGALRGGEGVRGVSTITQQLARNIFLTPERKISRKLREIILALVMDRSLGKRRVLELYLNTVEWADGIWGCAAATQYYLGKNPDRLDMFEAIVLSSLLPAPRRPLTGANLERACAVQNRVAWQLYLSGVLDQTEIVNCLSRVTRLKALLAQGESLPDAFRADRRSIATEPESDLVPLSRQIAEPLLPEDAVVQEYGIERERLELVQLRRSLGAKAWRELIMSGKFFRLDAAANTEPNLQ
jgi:monofunctional biosynthetic peptidoglycan transglycosylase